MGDRAAGGKRPSSARRPGSNGHDRRGRADDADGGKGGGVPGGGRASADAVQLEGVWVWGGDIDDCGDDGDSGCVCYTGWGAGGVGGVGEEEIYGGGGGEWASCVDEQLADD